MKSLTLPLPPSVNSSVRPLPGTGRLVKTKEARVFAKAAAAAISTAGLSKLTGPVFLHLCFYMPSSASDISNRVKLLEDALTGHAWRDDKQIVELQVLKRVAGGGDDSVGQPRVCVTYGAADDTQHRDMAARLAKGELRAAREAEKVRTGKQPRMRKRTMKLVASSGYVPPPSS